MGALVPHRVPFANTDGYTAGTGDFLVWVHQKLDTNYRHVQQLRDTHY